LKPRRVALSAPAFNIVLSNMAIKIAVMNAVFVQHFQFAYNVGEFHQMSLMAFS